MVGVDFSLHFDGLLVHANLSPLRANHQTIAFNEKEVKRLSWTVGRRPHMIAPPSPLGRITVVDLLDLALSFAPLLLLVFALYLTFFVFVPYIMHQADIIGQMTYKLKQPHFIIIGKPPDIQPKPPG